MITTTKPSASLRRRADKVLLRWQGRFDSDWSDRVLPWLCAAGLLVVLTLLALAKLRSLDGPRAFAVYAQAVWLLHHGHEPAVTINDGVNAFAPQAAFVLYPVSALSYVVPGRASLLLLQSGALALAVVPLWRICRRLAQLRVGTSFCLVVVYALFPPIHAINLAGFHPGTLALPALLWATCFGLERHWRRYVVCCLFIVLCRADLGLAVAGLGALVWTNGRRVEGRVVLLTGTLYAVVAVLVLEPNFAGGVFPHAQAFAAFGDTPQAAMAGMLTHPGAALGAVLREENFDLAVRLLAPLAFLPLLAPRYLLPVVPLEVLYLASDVPRSVVDAEQTVAVIAFLFVASAFALHRVGRMGVERVMVDRRVLIVVLLAAVLFFGRDSVSSPYRRPWAWGGRDLADVARLDAAKAVGPDRPVRASTSLLVELAERPDVWAIAPDDTDPDVLGGGVDAVVVDTSTLPWTDDTLRAVRRGLIDQGFRVDLDTQGVTLFLR